MADLPRARYAKAERIVLVCDNLNTHTRGAFYTHRNWKLRVTACLPFGKAGSKSTWGRAVLRWEPYYEAFTASMARNPNIYG